MAGPGVAALPRTPAGRGHTCLGRPPQSGGWRAAMQRGRDGGDREGAGPGWGHRRKAQGPGREQIVGRAAPRRGVSIPSLEQSDRVWVARKLWDCGVLEGSSVLEAPHCSNLGTGFASSRQPRITKAPQSRTKALCPSWGCHLNQLSGSSLFALGELAAGRVSLFLRICRPGAGKESSSPISGLWLRVRGTRSALARPLLPLHYPSPLYPPSPSQRKEEEVLATTAITPQPILFANFCLNIGQQPD